MYNMMTEIFFVLIDMEILNNEISLIFNEGLSDFEDLEDSFRGFIGYWIDPIIVYEIIDEDNEISYITDGYESNWSVNIGVNEFEWLYGIIFISNERLSSLFIKEIEIIFFWYIFDIDSMESFYWNMTESFVPELRFINRRK
jgi:hypothetical protein